MHAVPVVGTAWNAARGVQCSAFAQGQSALAAFGIAIAHIFIEIRRAVKVPGHMRNPRIHTTVAPAHVNDDTRNISEFPPNQVPVAEPPSKDQSRQRDQRVMESPG